MASFTATSLFFTDTATTEIYTLSLHDALPICLERIERARCRSPEHFALGRERALVARTREPLVLAVVTHLATEVRALRSEEHTSELQSQSNLVCRLLLEKKKTKNSTTKRITLS